MSWRLGATELLAGFAANTLSPVAVMESVLDRAAVLNPRLNALFDLRPEEALEAARASAVRWREGRPLGPLDGVPVLIKDSVAEAGRPYWRGTRARMGGPVPTEDSPPVVRLREAGAIAFAKTTMPDFGLLAAGVSSAHGITRNPWDLAMNTGGSSAGAGAAVAAGIGPLAIGTDLGGSVRLPAAQCGLVGLKPSSGVVPHLPYSAARVAGPMARSVIDAALMLSVLARPDPRARELGADLPATVVPRPAAGLTIGLLLSMGFGPEPEAEVLALVEGAARLLESAGARIVPLAPPFDRDVFAEMDIHFMVRAAMERDELPADRRGETLDFIARYCDRGDATGAKDYLRATEAMEQAARRYTALVATCDAVIAPVLPVAGFPAEALGLDPARPSAHVGFTAFANQAGLPAVSLFCGFAGTGLPVGVQIVGVPRGDAALLGVAARYEALRGLGPGFPPGLAA